MMKKLLSTLLAVSMAVCCMVSVSSEVNSTKEAAKQLVGAYIDRFSEYEFNNAVTIGKKETFIAILDKINVEYDSGISANALYEPSTKTIKIRENIANGEQSLTIDNTLWHETIHAIEDDNADFDKESSGNRDYDERNIEYMEVVVRALDNLRLVEGYAKKGETNEQLKARYENFLKIYNEAANAPGPAAFPVDDAQLMGWFGFYVKPDKIMKHYASGAAGERLMEFAEFYNSEKQFDMTGEWKLETGRGYTGTINITAQSVDSFTGTISIDSGSTESLPDGKISGKDISFTRRWDNGSGWTQSYKGTLSVKSGVATVKGGFSGAGGSDNWQMTKETTSADTSENKLVLQIGNQNMTIGSSNIMLDAAPQLLNDRTILPIRAVVEAIGGTIGWDDSEQKVTIKRNDTTIEMWVNQTNIKVNGTAKTIDVPPTIINGRTMVPVRFVADNIPDCSVSWNDSTQSAVISY